MYIYFAVTFLLDFLPFQPFTRAGHKLNEGEWWSLRNDFRSDSEWPSWLWVHLWQEMLAGTDCYVSPHMYQYWHASVHRLWTGQGYYAGVLLKALIKLLSEQSGKHSETDLNPLATLSYFAFESTQNCFFFFWMLVLAAENKLTEVDAHFKC